MNSPSSSRASAQVIALHASARAVAAAAANEYQSDAAEARAAAQAMAERAARRKRAFLRDCAVMAAGYVLEGLFLALFGWTETVSWAAVLLFTVPGIAACAVFAALIATGWSARLRDPNMTLYQSSVAIALCLLGLALFPAVSFVYGLILFSIFLTLAYQTPVRLSILTWAVVSFLVAACLLGQGLSFQVPHATRAEQVVAWMSFTLALGRCVIVSLQTNFNTALLAKRGKQLAAALAEIERLANHDELTGVLNRRSLLRLLGEEMARAARQGSTLSVALLDLDKFKAINDQFGHLAGDKVLKRFAKLLNGMARTTDRFGRHGGEEFLILFTDTSVADAQLALERIRAAVAKADWAAVSPGLQLGFSAGVAWYQSDDTAEQLLNRADEALYAAKDAGRGCTRVA